MPKAAPAPWSLPHALLVAFETNERINQFLLNNLPPEAWRANTLEGKGRNIAGIVSHMHNVRVMWLKAAAKTSKIPGQLEKSKVTVIQACRAFQASHDALAAVLKTALETDGRIKGFHPDVAGFIAYLIAHDAHHRGQVTMLARQAGHPVSQKTMFGMWEWGSRGKK